MTTSSYLDHLTDAPNILAAIAMAQFGTQETTPSQFARLPGLRHYHRFLLAKFGNIIRKPSFDYLSKTSSSWLAVGDRRHEIASDISLVIERYGLGVGLLVLHLQQIASRHILTQIELHNGVQSLAVPTPCLRGETGELVLSVPIRHFRSDLTRLADLNIAKPKALWNPAHILTHERDEFPCFYCSCPEVNPAEVVAELDGPRHGLSRHYSIGFTFAPFGNPLTVVHFLAWDRAARPLNMNRVPMTVSDLVKLTREINLSIRTFFADTIIRDYPVLDGISNGWAGNTIFHQHFQFFCPEYPSPVLSARSARLVVKRDDVTVRRLQWPAPVYAIRAEDALNTGLLGNDLAGIWRLLGGSRKVPYKPFRDGYIPSEGEKVHAHTQNLYVPGEALGRAAFVVLRDRERIDYQPQPEELVNPEKRFRAQRKDNLGVLEATGTLIADDSTTFSEMKRWQPADISSQIRQMIAAIAPPRRKITEFETAVHELFPT